jgi:hypothetical protein
MSEQIESMTLEQQIARLVRQRNALWRLIDAASHELAREYEDEAADRLYDRCEEIVGNTYMTEGVNYATGDVDRETGIYTRIALEMGAWR